MNTNGFHFQLKQVCGKTHGWRIVYIENVSQTNWQEGFFLSVNNTVEAIILNYLNTASNHLLFFKTWSFKTKQITEIKTKIYYPQKVMVIERSSYT